MDHEHPLPGPDEMSLIAQRITRPVVLVGMMGVGKSSLGRKLAAQLGAPFLDADEEIEKAAQMSIPEIFERHGEAFFRDGERRVIARLLGADVGASDHRLPLPAHAPSKGVKVIATGGGAFCNTETRALILDKAIAVWLDADLDTLVERTARKDNRPLLRQGNPRDILGQLKDQRAPFYAEAPIRVMSGHAPHAKTLSRLFAAFDKWLPAQPATTGS
ncbi:MAG TPA: shikimate kinase [Novosphingobium sp.]|nr:shikimate kinase [Novosphingobium sp.]